MISFKTWRIETANKYFIIAPDCEAEWLNLCQAERLTYLIAVGWFSFSKPDTIFKWSTRATLQQWFCFVLTIPVALKFC
jgi:hypothetical protein